MDSRNGVAAGGQAAASSLKDCRLVSRKYLTMNLPVENIPRMPLPGKILIKQSFCLAIILFSFRKFRGVFEK